MKEKGSKREKDSSTSSESDSDSDNSSGSSPEVRSKDKKKAKSTKSLKQQDISHSSDEESDCKDRNPKGKEKDSSRWDSPVNVVSKKSSKHDRPEPDHKPKRRNSDDEHAARRDRHEDRDRDRDSRHNRRKDDRQRDRDRSYEDRNRDGRHRNDNQRGSSSYDDRRQQSSGRRSRDRSPFRDRDNRRNYNNRDKFRRRRSNSADNANYAWGKQDAAEGDQKQQQQNSAGKPDKEKPNFGLSGKLTEETNTYRGVVIKYSEPPDARKPKRRWRLYPFKGEKAMQTLYIHRQSAYLIGRDRKIVDLPVDHPSCSKQHAALQYRLVPFTRDDGSTGKRIRPYIIDLESANGTFINNNRIDAKKYVELLEKDVIKFGFSSREYVMLHENSKDEAQDDDVKQEDDEVVNVKEEKDD